MSLGDQKLRTAPSISWSAKYFQHYLADRELCMKQSMCCQRLEDAQVCTDQVGIRCQAAICGPGAPAQATCAGNRVEQSAMFSVHVDSCRLPLTETASASYQLQCCPIRPAMSRAAHKQAYTYRCLTLVDSADGSSNWS